MAAPRSEPLSIDTEFISSFHVGARFTELTPIGYGANGLVFAGIDSECDKHVAIKKVSFHDGVSCKCALREIKIIRGLQHENIVRVHECLGPNGASLESMGPELRAVYIVQELLDTDLHCIIQSGQLTEQHAQLFFYQLLRGLKYLHSAHVVHRDVKPSNLLVNLDDLTLKLTDFGLSRVIDPTYNHKGHLTAHVGSTWYRSPEHVIAPRDYDVAVDVWAAGCVLGEMLLGRPLFPGAHEVNQLHLILDSIELEESDWNHVLRLLPNKLLKNHPLQTRTPLRERLPDLHPLCLDLLERLLRFNPADRLTAEEALSHPYLHELHCVGDEPVVERPFNIEHEVDDLSPTSIKEMLCSEVSRDSFSCGQRAPPADANLPSKIVNKNLRNQLIHHRVAMETSGGVATDARAGVPVVTESKMEAFNLEPPEKVKFYQSESELSCSDDTNEFDIEEVESNASSDCEKESYQSMLEHLNKLNMAKSVMESPRKTRKEGAKEPKKEVEKRDEDEKDTAEFSVRKREEDNQLTFRFHNNWAPPSPRNVQDEEEEEEGGDTEPLFIEDFMFPRVATVIELKGKEPKRESRNANQIPGWTKEARFENFMDGHFENDGNKLWDVSHVEERLSPKFFEALTINTEETENLKEFSQPSPKRNDSAEEESPKSPEVSIPVGGDVESEEPCDKSAEVCVDSNLYETPETLGCDWADSAKDEANRVRAASPLDSASDGENLNQSEENTSEPPRITPSGSDVTQENTNLVPLRSIGSSRESDLDSDASSDSNKMVEEAELQNLNISGSFSSMEKLKELCDSENQRCRTPSDGSSSGAAILSGAAIPDKETIKRKLNNLNHKKLKDIANFGAPAIEEIEAAAVAMATVADKNDKNRQSQGCRPKIFKDTPNHPGNAGSFHTRTAPGSRPRRSINLHKLRQEINERLKREEAQASVGELAAGGDWVYSSGAAGGSVDDNAGFGGAYAMLAETEMGWGGSRRTRERRRSRREVATVEYALPQPRWPCGGDTTHSPPRFIRDFNNGNNSNNNHVGSSNGSNNHRRGSNRRKKKTKAL